MNEQPTFYRLYCTNIKCPISIYENIREFRIPLTVSNLVTPYACPACKHTLVSAIDIELEQLTAELGVRMPDKTLFDTNY